MFKMLLIGLFSLFLTACGGGGGGGSNSDSSGGSNIDGVGSDPIETGGLPDTTIPEGPKSTEFKSEGVVHSEKGAYNLHVMDVQVEKAEASLAVLFKVIDRYSRSRVSGLTLDDVIISENGVLIDKAASQATVSAIKPELNYVFMIDVSSGTSESTLNEIKAALLSYVDLALEGQSSIAIHVFSDTVTQLLKPSINAVRIKEVISGLQLGSSIRAQDLALQVGMNASKAEFNDGAKQDVVVLITSGADTTDGVDIADLRVAYKHAELVVVNTSSQALSAELVQFSKVQIQASTSAEMTTAFSTLNSSMRDQITDLYQLTYVSNQTDGRHALSLSVKDDVTCSELVADEVSTSVFSVNAKGCVDSFEYGFSAEKFGVKVPEIELIGNIFGKTSVTLTASSLWADSAGVFEWSKRDLIGSTKPLSSNSGANFELELDTLQSDKSNTEITVTDSMNGLSKTFSVALGTGWANYHKIDSAKNRICTIRDHEVTAELEIHCMDDNRGTAGLFGKSVKNPTEIKVGESIDCAIHDNGVSCWEQVSSSPHVETLVIDVPAVQDPKELAVDMHTACVLDANGVQCWGLSYTNVLTANSAPHHEIPVLTDPSNLTLIMDNFSPVVCVKDSNLLKCWGEDGLTTRDWQGDKFYNGSAMGCFNNAGALACFDDDGRYKREISYSFVAAIPENLGVVDELFLPERDYNAMCAIVAGQVKCWAKEYSSDVIEAQLTPPNLINPTAVVTSSDRACAISDQGLVCWGNWRGNINSELHETVLYNPTSTNISKDMCVQDDRGLDCWGNLVILPHEDQPQIFDTQASVSGENHFCTVTNGKLSCFGKSLRGAWSFPQASFNGQLSVSNLIAGESFTCGLIAKEPLCAAGTKRADASVNSSHDALEAVPELNNFIKWSAGDEHVCALDEEGVKCWGNDDHGQTSGANGKQAKDVALYENLTCLITLEDKLECYGIVRE